MSPADRCCRLTVAIVVRDAADVLNETLRSVEGIANEFVVVDTGSIDRTRQVAQAHAALLLEREWDDDFSAARNHALAHVSGDWVLWLDAGEMMSPEDTAGLRAFLDDQPDPNTAYLLLVQSPPADGSIAGEQAARVRVHPNNRLIQFQGRIRETVTRSLVANGLKVEGLPYRIIRGAREHNPQIKLRRASRNIRLAELEMKEEGPQARLLNCLGDAFQTMGDLSRSSEVFQQALQESEHGSSDMLEAFYGLLTSLDGDQRNHEAQLSVCLRALEVYPLDGQLLCAMGSYLQTQGRLDLAARSYLTAYCHGKANPEIWHLTALPEVAAACHALTLQLQKKNDEAQRFLEKALVTRPDSTRLRRQLFELHVKNGRCEEALTQLDAFAERIADAEALRNAVQGACLAHQQDWSAARARLNAAYQAGCRDVVCLRWRTVVLIATGDTEKAQALLEEWKKLDPHSGEVEAYRDALSVPEEPAPEAQRRLRVDQAAPGQATGRPNAAPTETPAAHPLIPPPAV